MFLFFYKFLQTLCRFWFEKHYTKKKSYTVVFHKEKCTPSNELALWKTELVTCSKGKYCTWYLITLIEMILCKNELLIEDQAQSKLNNIIKWFSSDNSADHWEIVPLKDKIRYLKQFFYWFELRYFDNQRFEFEILRVVSFIFLSQMKLFIVFYPNWQNQLNSSFSLIYLFFKSVILSTISQRIQLLTILNSFFVLFL